MVIIEYANLSDMWVQCVTCIPIKNGLKLSYTIKNYKFKKINQLKLLIRFFQLI